MSSFETQRRLTVVNACANVVDFTGGREALTARAPSPPHALGQPPGLQSSTGPWAPSSSAATARASRAAVLPQRSACAGCPCLPAAEAAAGTLHAEGFGSCTEEGEQQTQGGPYLERQTGTQGCFPGICEVLSSLSRKEPFPILFQWSGSVFMLMAVAAGIPELLWRDCSLHFHAGREEFY